jgi:hypothetical protein
MYSESQFKAQIGMNGALEKILKYFFRISHEIMIKLIQTC